MTDTLYLASESDAEGFNLSQFVSLLGIEPVSTGTFHPDVGAPLDSAWEIWQENRFLPDLAPAFVQSYEAASGLRVEEVVAVDQALHSQLPESVRMKSLKAAEPFLDGKVEMKGNREWTRFAEKVESGTTPGHLATVFAVQSALYHLALPSALTSYAAFEFQSRQAKFPFVEMDQEENRVFSSILPRIPLALRSNSSENGDGILRVI